MAGIAVQPRQRARGNRWMTIGAIVFGLLTAYLVVRYVSTQTQAQKDQNTPTAPVIVAKKDIPLGTTITADLVDRKLVTPDVAVASALTQPNQAIGQRARSVIPAGAQIVPGMLVQAGQTDSLSQVVPAGKRAVAVGTNVVIGSGNHIVPGDFVDVMAILDVPKLVPNAATGANDPHLQGVATILQNIQVLAVADDAAKVADSGPQNSKKAGDTPDLGKNGTVTLAVDSSQAQLLFLAESEGKIRLALRPFGDQDVKPVPAALEPIANAVGQAR